MDKMLIRLDPVKLAKILFCLMAILLVLNLIGLFPVYSGAREIPWRITDFDAERNLPSLFSTTILAICGVLTWTISFGFKDSRVEYFEWIGLSLVFIFLSVDEAVMIHERVAHVARLGLDGAKPGLFRAAWVVPYAVLVISFAAVYLKFFLKLPKETKQMLAIGAALYVSGAIGVELLSTSWLEAGAGEDLVYYLIVTAEETLEMVGVITMVYAFACYLDRYHSGLSFQVSSGR